MSRPSTTVPDACGDTYFCESESDFHKLILAHVKSVARNTEDALFLTTGIKIICHEYFALLCQHKIKPYTFSKEWVDNEKDGFKEAMNLVNEAIAKSGVPIKEGENGKVEINYDDFERVMKEKGIV